ncbi:MAG: cobalamin-dependent protein [Bacillota bacterium]|nr:cobalamin-dependent protein [Bacillota bacterium]
MEKDILAEAMEELEEEKVLQLINERLEKGTSPLEVIKSLQAGMVEAGNKFQKGDYYLSELVMAGEIMSEANKILEPRLMGESQGNKGIIVIGTVKNDIHDLGKNIVVMLLKGAGYQVIDLGVDVPKEKFIDALKESGSPLLGLSVLLTSCQESMKDTIAAVKEAELDATIMIGGNYINEKIKEYVGADYFATKASDGVDIAKKVFN